MAAAKASSMVMALILVAGLLRSAWAVTHTVTWTFAKNATEYDDWSSQQTFAVGDEIAFVYNSQIHDVYEVTQADLNSCNLNNPIRRYTQSNAVVTLDRSGYFGFICGFTGHCASPNFMKMNVQVSTSTSPSASPSVAPVSAPALSPSVVPPVASPTSPRLSPSVTPSTPRPGLSPATPTPQASPTSDASSLQTRSAMVVGALLASCAAVLL